MLKILKSPDEIKNIVTDLVNRALNERNLSITYYVDVAVDPVYNRTWSIVVCYNDDIYGANTGDIALAKIAYRATNSLMTEYDIDFTMPYDSATNEVDDTEYAIYGNEKDVKTLIDDLMKEYKRVCKTYFIKAGCRQAAA